MHTTTLHYIYDPLCGWCYGAAPLVKAAREVINVRPHGGGMMTGARRQAVTPQLRDFVKPHDARIAQLSGQRFGEGYRDGLLRDTNAVFDSEPTIGIRQFSSSPRLFRAHFILKRVRTACVKRK